MQTNFDIQYAAMRAAIIEREFSHLNERQCEAVFHTEGPLLILAGAGSGKTTVLINRIINLLRFGEGYSCEYAPEGATEDDLALLRDYFVSPSEELRMSAELLCAVDPPRPWNIIAITFTNKAAKELQERLERAVGADCANQIWASTFHSACVRILRRDIERLGFGKSFTIYDTDDQKRVLTAILKRRNLSEKIYDVRTVAGMIGRAKDNLLTPKQFAEEVRGDEYKTTVAAIYKEYAHTLRESNALDFDDIIMKTVQLFQQNPDVLERYQRQFRYVLCDEYQDTNHAQYVLISLLAGGYGNVCVVGDDDQSIYKFRGATIANILEFEQHYPHTRTIRLEQNYRSTQNILSAANEVIRNNTHRKGKELWTDNGSGEKIRLHRSDSQESEAEYIAKTILEGYSEGHRWGDYAILYRNHVLSNNIESAFKRNSIPYRIVSGLRFFDRAEVKDMLAYLWVVLNPADNLRLRRIINVPARKIGARTVDLVAELAEQNGTSMFDIAERAAEFPEIGRAAKALTKFTDMIRAMQRMTEYLPLDEFYDQLVEHTGYVQVLRDKGNEEALGRIENVMELKSNLADYADRAEEPTLGGFMEEVSLFTDIDRMDADADAVVMMTMHSAKGLEFPYVFLCGMEDGIFPGFRSMENEEDMEEERRLCYVAMTRAKRELYLTCAERRMMYGQTRYSRPSQFLQEIPADYLDSNLIKTRAEQAEEQQVRTFERTADQFRSRRTYDVSARPGKARTIQAIDLKVGDTVDHKAFGHGMITSCKPMGGDMLLEISFDKVGTKRLMAKSAMQFMTKQ
ncbi:MAG: ATP-dependent helicase [Butyricicoccaceae bacterium]